MDGTLFDIWVVCVTLWFIYLALYAIIYICGVVMVLIELFQE